MALKEEVIDYVKSDLELPENYSPKIKRYVEQTEQAILNYTHQTAVPEGLKFVWVDMTVALMKAVLGPADEQVGGEREYSVTAIQEGDTSVTFGGMVTNINAIEADALSSVLTSTAAQLVQYRRVKWG